MNRRIFFIILAALGLALVVGLVWFWFFTGTPPAPATGSFCTGTKKNTKKTTLTNKQNNKYDGCNKQYKQYSLKHTAYRHNWRKHRRGQPKLWRGNF